MNHVSVLLNPILNAFEESLSAYFSTSPSDPYRVFDLTFGAGGHTRAMIESARRLGFFDQVEWMGLDRDSQSLRTARTGFEPEMNQGRLSLFEGSFGNYPWSETPHRFHFVLADLGYSSWQLEQPERGLSFLHDGPLDMRLDQDLTETAWTLISRLSETELANLLFEYGEERLSRRISRDIKNQLMEGTLENSTLQLAELIRHSYPPSQRQGRIHPATRSFQALRIAVNHELDELDSLLENVMISLVEEGVFAVISFHSLEDRRVKRSFRSQDGWEELTRKPVVPTEAEMNENPRSRSAKLRIARKVSRGPSL